MIQKRISLFRRLWMPQKELERYYRKRRDADFRENRRFKEIALRKRLHSILAAGIAAEHFFCDLDSKTDRYVSKESSIRLLEQGGDLCIYPEGAWNISENQPVMQLFNGIAEMAIRAGTEIVPIAVEQYGREYYVNLDENIDAVKWQLEQKQELTDLLRDKLATLKWEIWEARDIVRRDTIPQNYGEIFRKGIEAQMDAEYSMNDIWKTYFHNKANASAAEVSESMRRLKPCLQNAFLFDKRNAGRL